jgi:GTPase
MGFLDEVVITVKSGDGGRGCVSFRRQKYIPKGGPDGGNGGKGGDVVFRATGSSHSLMEYKFRRRFLAENGVQGGGNHQTGKDGGDCILEVPLGTVVSDAETGETLADLVLGDQETTLVAGGIGGKGNRHFATSTNRTPRMAQPGMPGIEKKLRLSLKFMADIGIIGLPNAGKSTLLSRLSTARPKVGSYPFTTLVPNLGAMDFEPHGPLVIADIPGLIEGASTGKGLGHRFLKHIERTRLLLHMLDITYVPRGDILEDFHVLRQEMSAFDPELARKPCLVVVNKMDLCGAGTRDRKALEEALAKQGQKPLWISAATGGGIKELKQAIRTKWKALTENGS